MEADVHQMPEKAAWVCPGQGGRGGFTLVELLVSTAIMLIVILVLLQVVAGMTNIWHNTSGQISSFQSARAAFSTLTRTLSRATLKTYIDYIGANGQVITNASTLGSTASVSSVAGFTRSSDLWFLCGPPSAFGSSMTAPANSGITAGLTNYYPGDAVFFNAPSGIASTSAYKYLQRSLNFFGFYVAYGQIGSSGSYNALPGWLQGSLGLGTNTSPYRFRLMEYQENTDQMTVTYKKTALASTGTYSNSAYASALATIATEMSGGFTNMGYGQVSATGQNTVLAENIVLLIIRPRVEPADEAILAPTFGITNYSTNTAVKNSIISPNYGYDSRAWWTDASATNQGAIQGTDLVLNSPNMTIPGTSITTAAYAYHMRNQLPPILDVAMVAVDPNSMIPIDAQNAATAAVPPAKVSVSTALFGLTGACNATTAPASANMDADLATFGNTLAANHIHYRVFRTSVQMEGAAWVDN